MNVTLMVLLLIPLLTAMITTLVLLIAAVNKLEFVNTNKLNVTIMMLVLQILVMLPADVNMKL
jgi:hypothetical protein